MLMTKCLMMMISLVSTIIIGEHDSEPGRGSSKSGKSGWPTGSTIKGMSMSMSMSMRMMMVQTEELA